MLSTVGSWQPISASGTANAGGSLTLYLSASANSGATVYFDDITLSPGNPVNPTVSWGEAFGSNEGLLMHELLHELGLQDDNIGTGLHSIDPSIKPDNNKNRTNTKQFSTKLQKDCFSGKGNKN